VHNADLESYKDLVRKVCKSLKQTGGASTDYQQVVIELKSLKNLLRQLEAWEPTEENASHVNAIRGMALACQMPLRDFLVKLEEYELSLGPSPDPRCFRAAAKKAKWAVKFSADVERFRTMIAAKNTSIALLLMMQSSQTLSRMSTAQNQGHNDLMARITEHRAVLHRVEKLVNDVDKRTVGAEQKLDIIVGKTYQVQASVVHLRSVGHQILAFLAAFPLEMQGYLQAVLQSNWQIYQTVLRIEREIPKSPENVNIHIEDALGDIISLPYQYLRHWKV